MSQGIAGAAAVPAQTASPGTAAALTTIILDSGRAQPLDGDVRRAQKAQMLALLLAAFALQQTPPTVEGDEIIVRATKRKCAVGVADRLLSDKEFKARAAEWAAGKPVRVIVPPRTDYKCLAKIMFKLNDHGVVRADFVDQ